MKTTVSTPTRSKSVIKTPDVASLESLIKSGALSRNLVKQLVASATISVSDAVAQWTTWLKDVAGSDRTAVCHSSYVNMWLSHAKLHKAKLSAISEPSLSGFINAKDGTKLATRRARLAALRSFFRFCTIRQWISYDPSREVRIKAKLLTHEQKETTVKICFTDDEIQSIDDYLLTRILDLMGHQGTPAAQERLNNAQFWRAATGIGRYAGLRLGDICSLEKASLKVPGKLIVHTDKRDSRVELPVNDKLAKALAIIPATNDKRFCFPDQALTHGDSSKRSKLSVQFSRILEACKISGKSFHCLRHTLASELNVKGDSIEEIAKALGHGSKESTKVYIHSNTETSDGRMPR